MEQWSGESRRFLALFVRVEGSRCLVVGAGRVGLRKVEALLEAGGRVTVVGPRAGPGIRQLARAGKIEYEARRFKESDLEGVMLLVVATNSARINQEAAAEAKRRGIICNVVDRPSLCSAIFPAVVKRGPLQIAISTGGASPAMARWIRSQVESTLGDEYERALAVLARIRKGVLASGMTARKRQEFFRRLAGPRLLELCKKQDMREIDRLLREAMEECTERRGADRPRKTPRGRSAL